LLPLKVGVALIAYSALEKDAINVPIVPVGLNYFRAHRFRGKATVEFGPPTYIDSSTLADYQRGGSDKRRVCNELLGRIEDNMRSVIVSVPDYETMQVIHAARRLYRQDAAHETAEQRQDMGRRFAEGYKRMLLQVKGEPPEEWLSLQKRMLAYQRELNDLGINDYQVVGLLYNTELNKNYQLYGRRVYPGSYEWEYYILGKDVGGLEIKLPIQLNNKEEIRDGMVITIPIDKNSYTVSIYNYSTPRYNPFPFN
jgi:hypothetical protein